jgi:triacylglycerol lipase
MRIFTRDMQVHVLSPSTGHLRASERDMRTSTNVTISSRLGRPTSFNLSPQDMPTRPPNLQHSPHRSPRPVLRWIGQSDSSPTSDSPPSSGSLPISPSSSAMQNLQDALTSLLPTLSSSTLQPPPKAVPPSIPLSDSPFFLRSLARVTLPTASLSTLAPVSLPFDPPEDPNSPGAPIFIQHSPPERLSLDSLRSLRDRFGGSSARLPNHTSRASLFSPSITPSWWWFQGDNKEDIDRLLSDEDRAPTVEEEQSRIHKKCAQHSSLICYPSLTPCLHSIFFFSI